MIEHTYGYASSFYKGNPCYVPMIDGRMPSSPSHYKTPHGAVQFSKGVVFGMLSAIERNGHSCRAVFISHDQKA
jgi:hypothetical protein